MVGKGKIQNHQVWYVKQIKDCSMFEKKNRKIKSKHAYSLLKYTTNRKNHLKKEQKNS